MNRRHFVKQGIGAAAALALAGPGQALSSPQTAAKTAAKKFKLKYAPSFGQFKTHAGDDPIAQIKFAADEGFGAMFDNGIMDRPVAATGSHRRGNRKARHDPRAVRPSTPISPRRVLSPATRMSGRCSTKR